MAWLECMGISIVGGFIAYLLSKRYVDALEAIGKRHKGIMRDILAGMTFLCFGLPMIVPAYLIFTVSPGSTTDGGGVVFQLWKLVWAVASFSPAAREYSKGAERLEKSGISMENSGQALGIEMNSTPLLETIAIGAFFIFMAGGMAGMCFFGLSLLFLIFGDTAQLHQLWSDGSTGSGGIPQDIVVIVCLCLGFIAGIRLWMEACTILGICRKVEKNNDA